MYRVFWKLNFVWYGVMNSRERGVAVVGYTVTQSAPDCAVWCQNLTVISSPVIP